MKHSNIVSRIALLTDIHGNHVALTALLEYYDTQQCDRYINLGDTIDIGAMSRQCLDTMLALPHCTNIMGNHDWDYVNNRRVHLPMSHTSGRHKAYVFDSIGKQYIDKVAQFARSVSIVHGGTRMTFVHYALASDTSRGLFCPLIPHPTAQLLDDTFGNTDGDVIFYGHKHEPSSIIGDKAYYDIGSVGCHRDSTARGAILDLMSDGTYNITAVAVPYDRQLLKRQMTDGLLPDGQYLFDFYIDRLYVEENA